MACSGNIILIDSNNNKSDVIGEEFSNVTQNVINIQKKSKDACAKQ